MTIFEESEKVFSMRRVCAFILVLASIAIGVLAVLCQASWQVVAAGCGIPLLAAIIIFFFTTWGDVTTIIKAWKEKVA